ncbi:endolytic transglycosylase MltG [Bacillus carboniphilus]|uniref:Endolytic murein transglycosylase n=1 Tax=Bacillus carboniphilus TaxID=86663 RepID=A0ABY9JXB1_9BACI|nr:endolytic transglycosylase MltG [Bacillus carboniphilus]WLR44032.1 endolytic transglycosylase MltG [Bacillus carboniphilus]
MSKKNEKKELILKQKLVKHKEAKIVRRIVFTIFVVGLLLFSVILGGGYLYVKSALQPVDSNNEEKIKVEIPIGSNLSTIASILEKNEIIKDDRVFKIYVKFKSESGFQAGTYQLNKSMEIDDIIASLKTGKVIQDPVFTMTIPEGKQIKEIIEIIAKATSFSTKEIEQTLTDDEFVQKMMNLYPKVITNEVLMEDVKYSLEGYLYPSTYYFYEEDPSLESIVEKMIAQTNKVVSKYEEQLIEQDKSVHWLLTFASLVEEEATKETDRKKIASVFYNRLEEGMRLETDPTVLYSLGEHKDRVLYEDLEVQDPYNTYVINGLPPGPIANAGESSMEAVLEPEETDYLFFLATSEGDVIFTTNFEDHKEAINEHMDR